VRNQDRALIVGGEAVAFGHRLRGGGIDALERFVEQQPQEHNYLNVDTA